MDPITHGLTGALIGKALFVRGAAAGPATGQARGSALTGDQRNGRVAVWVCVAAAMFPDVDVFFESFVQREMATIELHRGVTHSLVCLPLFVAAMATLTWWWIRWRAKRAPQGLKPLAPQGDSARLKPGPPEEKARAQQAAPLPWAMFAAMWAAGIVSHVVLDGATSWGTMLWAPLSRARTTWDWVFIIDFALTGIVLLPQVAAWVFARREGAMRRAAAMWLLFAACAVGVGWIAARFEAPFEPGVIPVAIVALGVLFFAPLVRGWGFAVSRAAWCRAGLLAMAGYYGMCAWMHTRALGEVREFAAAQQLRVDALGALPMPPGATRWLGLIRTPDGVYRAYFSVAANPGPRFEYIADDKMPEAVARAVEALPEVQTYRWFARFPVVSYREEGGRHVVELVDHRFYPGATSRPAPFQYRVVVNAYGEVEEQGWIE